MLDLEPATRVLTRLVAGVRDEQLTAPTPCTQACLGDLLDHVDRLSLVFAAAATKTPLDPGSQGPSADAARLGPDWRARIPARLASLASAWRDEAAWTGMTHAGIEQATVARNPQGSPGLFGPPVPVAEDAPLFDRFIGLTGRNPAWRAGDSA